MENVTRIYSATAEKAASVRANLSACGARARVRVMPNGSLRVVAADASQRDAVRDALVLSDACTTSGTPFSSINSRNAWNGPCEVFVRFLHA